MTRRGAGPTLEGMATFGRIGTTRETMLEILRRRDGLSVGELATELGLAGATVRRHLDVLLRDGHVSVGQVRGRTGRPRYAFSLTEAGAELFGHHYVRITSRLLHEIAALTPEETSGRRGEELVELILHKLSERLVDEYRPRVSGASVAERTRVAASLLEEEGFDFEVVDEAGELQLLGRGCPCHRLRSAGNGATASGCDHDRRMLAALIGGRVESRDGAELPGDFLCAYVVRDE